MTSIQFLEQFRPGGPWLLVHISVTGGIDGRWCATESDVAAFVAKFDGVGNCYFHVNPTFGPMDKKAARTDIASLDWLHVDIDRGDREQALKDLRARRPTIIIDSGNGYQGFWRLAEPHPLDGTLPTFEDAKLWNLAIEQDLGGDNCHNVDRIMRLPGTWNVPNARKKARGCVKVQSRLVEFNDSTHRLEDFRKAPPEAEKRGRKACAAASIEAERVDDLASLDIPDRVRVIIEHGRHPDEGPKPKDDSRSTWLFDALCNLCRADVDESKMFGLITDPRYKISESILEKGRAAPAYALRQIANAREAVGDGDVERYERGAAKPTRRNVMRALRKAGIGVRWNELTRLTEVRGFAGDDWEPINAGIRARIALKLEDERFNKLSGEKRDDAIRVMAEMNRFHPVREWLLGLTWDGIERLPDFGASYFIGRDPFEDEAHKPLPYGRVLACYAAGFEVMLLGAVKRVLEPGCKFDTMLVVQGAQGIFKSTGIKKLCPDEDWFTDSVKLNLETKEFVERTQGAWLVEVTEMVGNTERDIELVKAQLSRAVDKCRLAYEREVGIHKRDFVLFGSDNKERMLRDPTGSRRFFVVYLDRVDLEAIERDRAQLWAEAFYKVALMGCETYITDPDILDDMTTLLASAKREAELTPYFEELFSDYGDHRIRSVDVLNIARSIRGNSVQSKHVHEAMADLGWSWHRALRFDDGKVTTGYKTGAATFELRATGEQQNAAGCAVSVSSYGPRATIQQLSNTGGRANADVL